uniref:Uncharacterized protein n=1 Tax=Anopheles atroparvus TaxID=41427 RepID=A0A182J7E3_ANOAO
MSRVNYILCAVVVLLVVVEYTAGHGYHGRGYGPGRGYGQHHHHHRHRHHHYNPVRISLTIFDPKGMEVYVRRPNDSVQYFALEMNINEQNGGSPDVVLNTTEVVYGKYIMQDTEVVIKPGDFLNVTWSMGLAEGNATSGNQMLRVYQSMIKRNCSCEADTLPGTRVTTTPASISSIPPWSRPRTTGVPQRATRPTTTTETPTSSYNTLEFEGTDFGEPDSYDSMDQFDCEIDPSTNLCRATLFDERFGGQPQKLIAKPNRVDEVRALKGIIDSLLKQPCRRQPRSTLLTLANPQYSVDSSIDWLKYVRRSLGEESKLKSLASSAIRSARPRGDVIVFEMETQQDKLMMLYLCKEIGMSNVKDYD